MSDLEPIQSVSTHDAASAEVVPLRLAVISTPRTGNTWLRHMLAWAYDLDSLAVHRPSDLNWPALTARCIVQIHWHRDEAFLKLLDEHKFRVVSLARHPLDTLISLLNWVTTCPHPRSVWGENPSLDGQGGNECSLLDSRPLSPGFLEYACSERATFLLSLSREWLQAKETLGVRYEDLVDDTLNQLANLVETLGVEPKRPIDEAIEVSTMDAMRQRFSAIKEHFWQGRPGLWKLLLPASEAHQIGAVHARLFRDLGYTCDPDRTLTHAQAEANWRQLTMASPRSSSATSA